MNVTADEFCQVLYGDNVACVNRGTYPGTSIPLRKVPADAVLKVEDRGVVVVSDDCGGWIADRICDGSIGRRQYKRLAAALCPRQEVT